MVVVVVGVGVGVSGGGGGGGGRGVLVVLSTCCFELEIPLLVGQGFHDARTELEHFCVSAGTEI